MPEFPIWEKLALVAERPRFRTEDTGTEDFSLYARTGTRIQDMRARENTERAQEIQDLPFLTPEEKAALIGEILPNTTPILLASNLNGTTTDVPTDGGWHEPFVELAKDMLMPDWTDVVLLMATWPEWPVIKRAIKLPAAITKFIESLSKHLSKKGVQGIERSFELFVQTGNKKGLEESITALRKSGIKDRVQMADEIEHRMLETEAKVREIRKAQSAGKYETKDVEILEKKIHTVRPEPKLSEITDAEANLYMNRGQWWFENSLHPLFNGEKTKGMETLITKGEEELLTYERYVVYQRDKLKTPNLSTKVSDYLQVYSDMVSGYTKEKVNFTSIKEAKDYLIKLKNTHGLTQ